MALVLPACSGAVSVAPPDPAVDPAPCRAFMAALPDRLLDQERRETDPHSTITAAWGDPAITVRCGVPDPQALGPTAQLMSVDGVRWFPEELAGGYVFTTYERETNVEVTVPDDYSPEIDPVTELSPLVARTVPRDPGS